MKILVCDDRQDGFNAARKLIPKGYEVCGLYEQDLKDALRDLFGAISDQLTRNAAEKPARLDHFAGFDLAIIDNDLTVLEFEGARLSAEAIIGYVRAFTDVPYIVSLNKNRGVDFDLRYLFGDYQSHSDLAINTGHLECERLWHRSTDQRFAPWYWPRLPDAVARRRNQIRFVREHLGGSVWSELRIPESISGYLSRRAKAALCARGTEGSGSETTFRQFFDRSNVLQPMDRDTLGEMADGGVAPAAEVVSRLIAADVDRWIRRDLLGPQDVLIDLPHLFARMPYLLGDNARDVDHWNDAILETEAPFGMDAAIYDSHVGNARFGMDAWVPSPCFWWPSLNTNSDLFDLFLASDKWPDAVFCEDATAFMLAQGEEGPHEIEVEMESSWPRRHIARVEGRYYSPPTRIV